MAERARRRAKTSAPPKILKRHPKEAAGGRGENLKNEIVMEFYDFVDVTTAPYIGR